MSELRDAVFRAIAAEWNESIRLQRKDSPEGHQQRMADAVVIALCVAGIEKPQAYLEDAEDKLAKVQEWIDTVGHRWDPVCSVIHQLQEVVDPEGDE